MNRRDRFVVTALVAAFAVVGVAMALPATAPLAAPQVSLAPSVPYREGIVSHPSSITPLTARTQADRDLVALLFRGLLHAGPDGMLLPDLARSWSVSQDGKDYTFLLRDDAYWDDGQPVTSADVVFTVGLLQDSSYGGPLGASWQRITVTADSSDLVRFHLQAPMAGFLRQATLPLLPQRILHGISVSDLADSGFSSQPVGDGPFQLLEVDDSHAILQRVRSVTPALGPFATFDSSPTPSTPPSLVGANAVNDIEMVFFDDSATAAAQFRAGKLDAVGGLAPEAIDSAIASPGSRLLAYPMANLTGVVLNQRPGTEFRDPNVRLGLLSAIDRTALLRNVLEGRGSVAEVPVPAWSKTWFDTTAVKTVAFDTSAAMSELTAAGWKRSGSGWTLPKVSTPYQLKLLTPDEATNPVVYRTAVAVAADWRAIGLDVTLVATNSADYRQRLAAGQFSAAVVDFELGLDPDLSPILQSSQASSGGSNVSGIQDTSLDHLLQVAQQAISEGDRKTAVSAVEKYVSTNLPILSLCFTDYDFVVAGRVRGLDSNEIADPSDRYWDVIDWRLASDG
ncbi:MAG TPA: ABC transporter substrate-binding protein [Candidatus Limnocylindrales bacterium]